MAQRTPPTRVRSIPEEGDPLEAESVLSAKLLDPVTDIKARDSLFADLIDGSWADTQQHGRAVYDLMMRDPSVAAPYNLLVSIIKSLKFDFRAQVASPTPRQKEMVEFLNTQLKRIGLGGTHRHGWTKFVDGVFGQGLKYGFSLTEISTKVVNWRGRPYVQLDDFRSLPQRSLDGSSIFDIREVPASTNTASIAHFEYDCFRFDRDGNVVAYIQNRQTQQTVTWEGPDRNRILHYTHGVGDGNPFGQSRLWNAYYPWADKYVSERLEQWKLENADSFMTMSYDSDTPLPEVHKQVIDQIKQSGKGVPILVAPRSEWGSVSTISDQYTAHMANRKKELRQEIALGILVPEAVFTETEEGDVDSRNLIQVFFKFALPALLKEVSDLLTWQLGKRLIDANYSNVEPEDYPVARSQVKLSNDLRVSMPLLQMLLPFVDDERLGEFAEELLPGVQREWFPEDGADSVGMKRHNQPVDPSGGTVGQDPPTKEPGSTRERTDGQTENPSGVVDTQAGVDDGGDWHSPG